MPDPNQPRENDAVLGSQSSPPADGVVLGGLAGVKRGLASEVVKHRIAALEEALKYGDAGWDLVIQALQDEAIEVQKAAFFLLQKKTEPHIKQILGEHFIRLFKCLYTFRDSMLWGDSRPVYSVAISPDGNTFVSGGADRKIKVWDLLEGRDIRTYWGAHSHSIYCLAISPETIVSGSADSSI